MVRTPQLTPGTPRDDAQVDSLRRGLEVLRLFDLRHRKLTLADIARKLELSRPTTEKLVQTLQAQHFLQATGDSYEPHIACLALGRAAKKGLAVGQAARPLMRELSQRFGVHVTLSTRDRLHMLVVEHCVPAGRVQLGLTSGARFPMAVSASGRAYLWGRPKEQRDELLRMIEADAPSGVSRPLDEVYAAFRDLEKTGWCYLAAPVATHTASIATPVKAGSEFALAAMAVSVDVTEAVLRGQVAASLLAIAERIALAAEDED
ncbi:helix-turn-helix domain-containing protein [Bordetella petrii]|uniref:Transcriptional regulator, IclR family n=1 Tax=Bordetella petrii (strain ATCC BAA-461 / DSM 12804 / CCUG 43448 / CIP 107267 / Se-1111R) TaxID=340100 RepID=A9IBX2_BORPD|nr:helix-turn-helix domain-containing protein [Bordetella petrii]CAP41494.1 transcriptional regulator, IclR family [Bordetella petrii]